MAWVMGASSKLPQLGAVREKSFEKRWRLVLKERKLVMGPLILVPVKCDILQYYESGTG